MDEEPRASTTPAVHTGQGLGRRRQQLSAGLGLPGASLGESRSPGSCPRGRPGEVGPSGKGGERPLARDSAGPGCSVPGRGGSGDGCEREGRARLRRERRKSRPRRAAPAPRAQAGAEAVSEGRGAPRREGGELRQRKTPPGTPASAGSRGSRRKEHRADEDGRATAQKTTQRLRALGVGWGHRGWKGAGAGEGAEVGRWGCGGCRSGWGLGSGPEMRGSGGWRWREGTCEVGVGGCGVGSSRWAGQGPLPLPPGWAGLGCACERRRGGVSEGLSVSPQGGSTCTKDPVSGLRSACYRVCVSMSLLPLARPRHCGGSVSRYIHTGGE